MGVLAPFAAAVKEALVLALASARGRADKPLGFFTGTNAVEAFSWSMRDTRGFLALFGPCPGVLTIANPPAATLGVVGSAPLRMTMWSGMAARLRPSSSVSSVMSFRFSLASTSRACSADSFALARASTCSPAWRATRSADASLPRSSATAATSAAAVASRACASISCA